MAEKSRKKGETKNSDKRATGIIIQKISTLVWTLRLLTSSLSFSVPLGGGLVLFLYLRRH